MACNGNRLLPNAESIAVVREQLNRLTARGLLGYYDSFEVTEITAALGRGAPLNVFSLIVGERAPAEERRAPRLAYQTSPS